MARISRREFLRLTGICAAASVAAACAQPAGVVQPTAVGQPSGAEAAPSPQATAAPSGAGYAQSPVLDDKVTSGELPPVEERLPTDPLILEPVEEIGQYGGTWRRFDNVDTLGRGILMMGYVEPFRKHTRDLTAGRPNLAESWEYNENYDEVTIHLRKGIKWSDGEPLTVDDYLFWWNDLALDPDVPIEPPAECSRGGVPMEATKIDDFTVRLKLSQPDAFFMEFHSTGYGQSSWFTVPAHYLKQFHPKYNKDVQNTDDLIDHYNNRVQYPDMPTFTAWQVTEFVSGERAVFERNPYYWKVDPQGQQLPYVDRVEITIGKDDQLLLLKAIAGEIDAQFRDFAIKDVPLLRENEAKGDYRTIMWDRGTIGWPWIIFMYDYQDEGIVDLFYTKEFMRALSVALDRERMNNIVYLGLGQPSQAAMIASNPEYQLPGGKEIFEQWSTSYTGHDPEQAKAWLDGLGVVDKDGDGWRERPDGTPLELVMDLTTTDKPSLDIADFMKEDWEAVGIKTTLNPIDGTVIWQRQQNQETMIRVWGSAGSDWLLTAPPVWTPIYFTSWCIGGAYLGKWYETGGKEGVAPRPGSAWEKLLKIYEEAKSAKSPEETYAKILEGYQVHIDEGPLSLGTIAKLPSPGIAKNSMRNIPGFAVMASWNMGYPGTNDPEQWFFKTA